MKNTTTPIKRYRSRPTIACAIAEMSAVVRENNDPTCTMHGALNIDRLHCLTRLIDAAATLRRDSDHAWKRKQLKKANQ